jgi:hypothetical protein
MRAFISCHKKTTVALISTVVALTITYCASFTTLQHALNWISRWTGNLDLILISFGLFGIFIGKKIGEKTSDKIVLAIISVTFSVATFWVFWIIKLGESLGNL